MTREGANETVLPLLPHMSRLLEGEEFWEMTILPYGTCPSPGDWHSVPLLREGMLTEMAQADSNKYFGLSKHVAIHL